tara:strand:+ start:781 stop:1035 length:255 start_codon:yes stop_codon:yes gene_type:complete
MLNKKGVINMKLSTQQLAIVSKLIDLNDEYFQARKMHNPIKDQINDNLECYESSIDFVVTQRDFVNLRHQIEDFFNQRYYPTKN